MTNHEYSNSLLTEKVKNLEQAVKDLRTDVNMNKQSINDTITEQRLLKQMLKNISEDIGEIRVSVNKDSGWRGFFIDFIKAAVQIAALIGAGKFIF